MARSLRNCLFALGIVTASAVVGIASPSWAQVVPDPAAPAKADKENTPPKIQEVVDAIESFKKRDFDETLKQLEAAVKKHPELPPAQIIMFQLFGQSNQAALARMALERAVLADPNDPEAYVILGDIALQERRVTEADLMFSKAKELVKSLTNTQRKEILEPRIISGLAAVAEAREKWALAQSNLEALLKISPKDAVAMQRLARAMFQQKNTSGALDKLREAARVDPKNVLTPEAALGGFYEGFGDRKNATTWMTQALKTAPEDLRTRLVVARWALETGQIEEARTQAEKALKLDPKSLDAKLLLGVIALHQKNFKEAEKQFQDAHLQSPSLFAATNNLALALAEQTDESKKPDLAKLRRAVEYANANYQQNPRNAEAASTLGWVLFKAGDLDRAEQALRLAASSGNLSPDTAYYLAQVFYVRGHKEEAKALLDAVLKSKAPFSMRAEATELSEKLKSEPAPKKDSSK